MRWSHMEEEKLIVFKSKAKNCGHLLFKKKKKKIPFGWTFCSMLSSKSAARSQVALEGGFKRLKQSTSSVLDFSS